VTPTARRRVLGAIATWGSLAFTAAWVLSSLATPGYNAWHRDISALAATGAPLPWITMTGKLLLAAGLLSLAIGLAITFAGRGLVVAVGLLTTAGLAIAVAGLAREDCDTGVAACIARQRASLVSWHHTLHGLASVLFFLAILAAPGTLFRPLRGDRDWHALARYSVATTVVGLALLVVYLAAPSTWVGLAQRVFVTVPVAWAAVLGTHLIRRASRPRGDRDRHPAERADRPSLGAGRPHSSLKGTPMTEIADSAPDRFAALIAPTIEHLTLTVVRQAMAHAAGTPVVRAAPPDAMELMGQLRIALMARPVTPAGLAAVYRYRDGADIRRAIDGLRAAQLIDVAEDGTATATGRALLTQMYRVTNAVTQRLWAGHDGLCGLSELAGRAVQAGLSSGGAAYATMAPPFEPVGADAGLCLHTRLSALRYHRADAHAAAWQAAGLTRATVAQLPAGPDRQAIEAETNRRNGPAFAALTTEERATFGAGLAALAG
jgi:Protein of unknown function (DUF998)